jgi:hypothetical protein
MLAVMDDGRVRAGEAHAAWSESFSELLITTGTYVTISAAFFSEI